MALRTDFDIYLQNELAGRQAEQVIHKFGHNEDIGTTFEPVATGGIYRTPQVGGATKLRIKAGNAADTAAGAGAREITLQGLNQLGVEVTETLATAGASASLDTTNTFIRFYRGWVSASGTYATSSAGSHVASIVIENAAGTEDWATIDLDGFPVSQTEIASYSVPLGLEAYVFSIDMYVDSNKTADVLFFQRQNILETAAPYTAMRLISDYVGIVGPVPISPKFAIGPFPALTDIGFMAKAAQTANVEVNFEILLVKSND